jgi:hypothetical protein
VRAEIVGLHEQVCKDAKDLLSFFDFCFNQRSTASTNMNATSSRSHALFTITVRRVVVSVGDGVDKNLRAMVRTEGIESKLHLVDLAGVLTSLSCCTTVAPSPSLTGCHLQCLRLSHPFATYLCVALRGCTGSRRVSHARQLCSMVVPQQNTPRMFGIMSTHVGRLSCVMLWSSC